MIRRVCACGAAFYARSGKQKFCSLGCPARRGSRPSKFAALDVPERWCERCGRPFVPRALNQRFCSKGCRYAARRYPSQRYDGLHKRRRAIAAELVAEGDVRCARGAGCRFAELVDGVLVGGLILPWQRWDLGHPDGQSVGGPEHRECNRATAGRRRGRIW